MFLEDVQKPLLDSELKALVRSFNATRPCKITYADFSNHILFASITKATRRSMSP